MGTKAKIVTYVSVFFLGILTANISFFTLSHTKIDAKKQNSPLLFSPSPSSTPNLESRLQTTEEEIAILKAQQRILSQTLGVATSSTEVAEQNTRLINLQGKVKLANLSTPRVNIYQETNTNSKIVAQMIYGQEYVYSFKQADWYKIDRPAGFVQASYIVEIK